MSIACVLSYKLGSTPVALASARPAAQELTAAPPLPTAPTTWVLTTATNVGGVISVTRPAGGTGVKHVASCVTGSIVNNVSNSQNLILTLVDGNLGGTKLMEWEGAALPGTSTNVNLCDLNIVGPANTPMTLQIGGVAGVGDCIRLVGFDAM
jgi:hypothetical protein